MPTYLYRCACGEFEHWASIHAPALTVHDKCGGPVVRVLGPVRTHGVGQHGAHTRWVDRTERQWDKDLPAYKRFRDRGLQPAGIDGADRLEATADNEFVVRHGDQARGLSERALKEGIAEARDIMEGR